MTYHFDDQGNAISTINLFCNLANSLVSMKKDDPERESVKETISELIDNLSDDEKHYAPVFAKLFKAIETN